MIQSVASFSCGRNENIKVIRYFVLAEKFPEVTGKMKALLEKIRTVSVWILFSFALPDLQTPT